MSSINSQSFAWCTRLCSAASWILVWQKVTSLLLLWADVNLAKWDLISHLIRRIIALIGCFEWENCPANDQETAGPHWVIVAGGLFLSAWWGSIWYEAQRRVSVIAIACMCPSDPLSLFMLGNVRPIAEHRLLVKALSCGWIGSTGHRLFGILYVGCNLSRIFVSTLVPTSFNVHAS